MLPKKLPEEDLIALQELMNSDTWKVALKYIELLQRKLERKFLDDKDLDMLQYKRGKVDGGRELLNLTKDLKDHLRSQYFNK